jgi:hypothetical protein
VSVENSLLRRYVGGAEVLPEETFDIAAREACRLKRAKDCASFVARWSVDYPKSALRRAALPTLRKTARPRESTLSAARLERLRAVYSGQTLPSEDAPSPLVEAQRVTDLFLNHYHHVVPLDPRVLEEAWGRCEGEDCEAGRARAAELLWGLDDSALQ